MFHLLSTTRPFPYPILITACRLNSANITPPATATLVVAATPPLLPPHIYYNLTVNAYQIHPTLFHVAKLSTIVRFHPQMLLLSSLYNKYGERLKSIFLLLRHILYYSHCSSVNWL